MNIRELCDADIREALDLVWTVFREFEAPEYEQEGIDEFKRFISLSAINEMRSSGDLRIWGLYDEDILAGVIASRGPAHISLLFVRKDYQRQGIARELFAALEDYSRASGADEITVNSSPYAVDIYHRLGFISTDIETVISGIRFTPMKFTVN
jgi:GNAT superfamily N-acetyltransferase